AELCVEAKASVADACYGPHVDLSQLMKAPPKKLEAACLVVRSSPRHPGLSAIAERCAAQFRTDSLAVYQNDFYGSGGFPLWGSARTGLLLDGGPVCFGGRKYDYGIATLIGLCHLFGSKEMRAVEGYEDERGEPVLLEELTAEELVPKGPHLIEALCALAIE